MSVQVGYYEAWINLMRSWGFTVHEAAGWRTRDAEPRSTYLPGLLYIEHHDASTTRSGNWGALNYIINNKLANIVTARNGEITVTAAGVAWHAGVGSRGSLGNIPKNGANPRSLGNEVCNSGSEPYSAACTRAIIATERAWAIVSGREGEWNRIIGHKEWADPQGRKTDPRVNMDERRRDVAAFVPPVNRPDTAPSVAPAVDATTGFPVIGAIRSAYDRPGVAAYLGAAKMPEAPTSGSDPIGRYQAFERGYIFWHPSVDNGNAHVVQGSIAGLWDSLGRETFTGFPLTDESTTPDGIGRYNHFDHPHGMSIYWSPATGAQLMRGAIRDKWASLGWEKSKLGYPTTGEVVQRDGSILQIFQGGASISYTGAKGAVVHIPGETPIAEADEPTVEVGEVAVPEPSARLGLPVRAGTHRITSGFGPRGGTQHRGIDFASVKAGQDYTGADILSAEYGTVIESRGAKKPGEAGWVGGFGSWVIVEHNIDGKKIHTVYGHMYPDDLLVKVGEKVTRGQKIARVGNNGDSSGAHLHFEVWIGGRYNGTAVDPAPWLTD